MLGRKLLQIRNSLGLSQSEILRRLGVDGLVSPARISEYESGVREPSLSMLLGYATVARIHLEHIIDDDVLLPDKLPGSFNYQRSKRKAPTS